MFLYYLSVGKFQSWEMWVLQLNFFFKMFWLVRAPSSFRGLWGYFCKKGLEFWWRLHKSVDYFGLIDFFFFFQDRVSHSVAQVAWNLWSSYLCLLSAWITKCWYYRCVPPSLALGFLTMLILSLHEHIPLLKTFFILSFCFEVMTMLRSYMAI
jgi:hypothetical protein